MVLKHSLLFIILKTSPRQFTISQRARWVFFHEMGHNFLGASPRMQSYLSAPSSFSYSEGFASDLGMYSAAMMQERKSIYQIPDSVLQTQTLLPTYHLSTTLDLDNYWQNSNYSQLNPSVICDIMLSMAQIYGYDKLIKFYAVFLPNDPIPIYN